MELFHYILVPTDFDEPSQRALDVAISLAEKFNGSLALLHVYELPMQPAYGTAWPMDLVASTEAAARERLEQSLAPIRRRVPAAVSVLSTGVPWREILLQISATRADSVVIGTHGRRGLSHALLGSVAEKIVRMSPVPVLTVRPPQS
jgi:nucleotide-binding universal stress UspA family protein